MPRVITFSRYFPKGHPKAGQPTRFMQKMWQGLIQVGNLEYREAMRKIIRDDFNADGVHWASKEWIPKWHTIRSGNRWKVGDKFSPRVWSGKPYASKQIQFAPDIEIKKVQDFEIVILGGVICFRINDRPRGQLYPLNAHLQEIAKNDGLNTDDLISWFTCHPKARKEGFRGQILCWNQDIEY